MPEFVPNQEELLNLAQYWERIFLERSFFIFDTRQIGSHEIQLCQFAECRVMRIVELLELDAIQAVREERDAFAKRIGLRKWKKFRSYLGPRHLHGDEPARSAELEAI